MPTSSRGLLTAIIRIACSSVTRYSNNCNRFSTDDKRWDIGPSARCAYGHPGQQFTQTTLVNSIPTNAIQQHTSIEIQWENSKIQKAIASFTTS